MLSLGFTPCADMRDGGLLPVLPGGGEIEALECVQPLCLSIVAGCSVMFLGAGCVCEARSSPASHWYFILRRMCMMGPRICHVEQRLIISQLSEAKGA